MKEQKMWQAPRQPTIPATYGKYVACIPRNIASNLYNINDYLVMNADYDSVFLYEKIKDQKQFELDMRQYQIDIIKYNIDYSLYLINYNKQKLKEYKQKLKKKLQEQAVIR